MKTRIKSSGIEPNSITAPKFSQNAVAQEKFAQGVGSSAPGLAIASIAATDSGFNPTGQGQIATAGGYIKITGTGFESGAVVMIGNKLALATSFISSTELHVQIPAQLAGSYLIQVTNPNGRWALKSNGVTHAA